MDNWDYEQIVLKSLPIDGTWIRADIIHFEQEERDINFEKAKDPEYTHFNYPHHFDDPLGDSLAPATVSKALKNLWSKGIIGEKRISHKNVWYWQRLDKKISYITNEFTKEISVISEDMSKIIHDSAQAEAGSLADDPEWCEDVLNYMKEDKEEYGGFIASLLIEQAFKIIKETHQELADKEFYVSSNGSIAPKELVDKLITTYDRRSVLLQDSICGQQYRYFYNKIKKQLA